MNKIIRIIIIMAVFITVISIYVTSINAATTFYNPMDTVNQRPDPFVYKHTDGYYYGVCTIQDNTGYVPRLDMWKSESLVDLFTKGSRRTIWNAPSSGWNTADIWAPELHRINGVWYIYYSANCRFGVLSNSNADPYTGSWTDHGRISPDVWAIDPTILNQNGNMYVIWSGQNNGQVLNITRMSSPTSLTGSSVQISSPTYSWETQGLRVNEGPEIIQNSGTTYCIYSASYCATQYYCLGQLSIPGKADPMVAGNWTKKSSTVFQRSTSQGIYGTGHASFTKSKDGKEDWIVYHATITPSSEYQPRYVCMQSFTFNSDGSPNFGSPLGRTSPLNYPSGEGDAPIITSTPSPNQTEYQAEDAYISEGVVETDHSGYTGNGYVNLDNNTTSYIEFTVNSGTSGSRQITFRYANGSGSDRPVEISVNGNIVSSSFSFPDTVEWTSWSTKSISVNLNSGINKIRVKSTTDTGAPNLDKLDLSTGTTVSPTPSGSLGDVNADWNINITDALLVAQYYVGGVSNNFHQENADVNTDGNINITDALLISQYYVGIISSF